MHIVTVLFTIHAAHWQAFKEAMHANAATSLATESGCRQFDVCEGLPGTYTIFLDEVYDAQADFKAHLNADHFCPLMRFRLHGSSISKSKSFPARAPYKMGTNNGENELSKE